MKDKKQDPKRREESKVVKAVKGINIVWTIFWVLLGVFILGILIFVGVRLWEALPIFRS